MTPRAGPVARATALRASTSARCPRYAASANRSSTSPSGERRTPRSLLGDERIGEGRLRLPPAERAVRTRAGDRDARAAVRRECREYADHGVTCCRIQELDVGGPSGDRERRGSDDLARLKHRPAVRR